MPGTADANDMGNKIRAYRFSIKNAWQFITYDVGTPVLLSILRVRFAI